ncbi:hypothetical protein ACFC0M_25890 [Streptomyces sp. NPDC056149]|nr:hypothetical protein [Streptomyces sp. WZ-12]
MDGEPPHVTVWDEGLPGALLVRVPDADHASHQDRPEVVNEVLTRLWQS